MFQSTFPRGERRIDPQLVPGGNPVSIHVPARGTTFRRNATPALSRVSIHVPARGTTVHQLEVKRFERGFNPRSREGNDSLRLLGVESDEFQSTFPRGERPEPVVEDFSIHAVSIHVPARGTTGYCAGQIRAAYVSIHVPARGTTDIQIMAGRTVMFQSTFPRGERLIEGYGK